MSVSKHKAVSFDDLLRVFLKIGCLSFGGPAGQIAMLHRELVDVRGWIDETEYLSALNFCMLLPGPEAMQLATYMGWRLHGVRGGLAAGLLFILPGALVMLALAIVYAMLGNVAWVEAAFFGVKAAVLAIVVEALLRVARKALRGRADWVVAALAFSALFAFGLPFPLIIAVAALYGFITRQGDAGKSYIAFPPVQPLIRTAITGAALWLAPLAALWLAGSSVFTSIGSYFARLAIVTFGGAYAVLADMADTVVAQKGWLSPQEMIDALALAETTPGPLILVTQFVGFLAAYKQEGLWLGIAAAALTLWMTFVPSFTFIFAGAPYIEAINARPRLKGALSAITAAVVGVILNLSFWFALHVLFSKVTRVNGVFKLWIPDWTTFDWRAAVLGLAAAYLLLRRHWSVGAVLAVSAAVGLALRLANI
jgi:chromate transporter